MLCPFPHLERACDQPKVKYVVPPLFSISVHEIHEWLMLSKATGRVQLQDCQTWVQAYVVKLVEMGILHNNADTVVAAAPMN